MTQAVDLWLGLLVVLGAVLTLLLLWQPLTLAWRELLVPEELTADQVSALLRQAAAVRQGPVQFVVSARAGAVRFLIGATDSALASLTAAAAGIMPGVRFEATNELPLEVAQTRGLSAQRVGWRGPWPLLRTEQPEFTASGLLGSLASVSDGEHLRLIVRLWPVGRVHRPVASSERKHVPPNPRFLRLWWPAQPPREEVRAIRVKFSGLIVRSEIIVVAEAAGMAAASGLAHRVVAALRTAGGLRGVLQWRRVTGRRLQRLLQRRTRPLPTQLSTLLAPNELVSVIGLPVAAPSIAGIAYGTAPRLMPPGDLPERGRVFATSTWPSTLGRSLAQPVIGGLQHSAIIGPTGSGKTTLISSLVQADMAAGRGAFVLDLKGDLVNDLLGRVPAGRRLDVVVLEPARGGAQPGLRLFPVGGDRELTTDLILGTLQSIFRDSWGIRSSQYLGMALRTLATLPGATLVELPLLFHDAQLRARALGRLNDPWLQQAWQRFLALSAADQAAQLASPLNKLEELVSRSRLRLVLGQSRSKLDFREALARQRIVLVSLPPGLLGMPATQLLAALTLWQFFQAIESRAALPPEQRHPYFAYVDELAVLQSLPVPIDSLLERARGHGVGLTVSPQALSQLIPNLRSSLLANVGSLVAFKQMAEDEAALLARALPGVTAKQLQHLGPFEVALRLSLGPGRVTPTMSGQTLAPTPPVSDPAAIRQRSGARWGQTIDEIDAALASRLGLPDASQHAHGAGSSSLGVSRRRP